MKVHIYNPENDLALAAGTASYTPPPAAVAQARRGALLPLWWADADDAVVCDDPAHLELWERDWGRLPVNSGFEQADGAAPWGWSAAVTRRLSRLGVRRETMPSDVALEAIRLLSHRRTSMRLLGMLDLEGVAREVGSVDEVMALTEAFDGNVYLKSPWSCSGRGVMSAARMTPDAVRAFAAGTIRRQGSVMVERAVDATADFAALFIATDHGVRFQGWSMFQTSPTGKYEGQIVDSDSHIASRLASLTPIAPLEATVSRMEKALTEIVGDVYRGPLGVDMMVRADGGVHPCVEVNLRRTMGFVAADIHRRLAVSGQLKISADGESYVVTDDAGHPLTPPLS